jgi:hypothetical protein
MRTLVRLAIVAGVLFGTSLTPSNATAECMGTCVQCDYYFVPICVRAPGAGHCYCAISYIYDTCQGRLFCHVNPCEPGQWPPCENARCEPAAAPRLVGVVDSEAGTRTPTRVFRPYFRTSSTMLASQPQLSVPRS